MARTQHSRVAFRFGEFVVNIFVLSRKPQRAAVYHHDKHVVKMPIELGQMLSTACRLSGVPAGYKVAYQNHPCTLWVRASLSNWLWARDLACKMSTTFVGKPPCVKRFTLVGV